MGKPVIIAAALVVALASGWGAQADDYYLNSNGQRVHRPEYAGHVPRGATAICRDGTYSFSKHHRGTCSHHGGVAKWR